MSAEIPPPPSTPRARVVASNRRLMLLFAALTLILTVATVWGGRIWLRNSETLTFAVGNADSTEARFATRLAAMLKNASSRLHIKIVTSTDNTKALAQFDRKDADLAVLRTDARIPPRARALAILEHDVLLLISPGSKKIASLAELKKRRLRYWPTATPTPPSSATSSTFPMSPTPHQNPDAPPNSTLDKLLTPGVTAR
ncbi:MAG: hypothetical protein WDN50_24985 [Bradyrhizobium sp.]